MKRSIKLFTFPLGLLLFGSLLASVSPAFAAEPSLMWSAPEQVNGASSGEIFDDASCPSANLCVAAGYYDEIATSTNPSGGASEWSTIAVEGVASIFAVSCPSENLCVATGQQLDFKTVVVTSTNPTGGAKAWHITANLGAEGGPGNISCPSTSLCVGVGVEDIWTSTNPTGGAGEWAKVHVGAGGFEEYLDTNVSCASVNLCVVVSGQGVIETSTNPTGGAGAWTITHVGEGKGENFFTVNVSCPSTALCVVTGGEFITTSTNPTSGAGAWTITQVKGAFFAAVNSGLTCPSASFCVIVVGEEVWTSTNPTGGAGEWAVTNVPGALYLDSVSCPSESLCIAFDEDANVSVGTPVVDAPPANIHPPTISGVPQVGQTLTCAPGSWSGHPAPAFTYQWTRDGGSIGEATKSTYVVQAADEGHTLACTVTASNGSGKKEAASTGVSIPVKETPAGGGGSGGGSSSSTPAPGDQNAKNNTQGKCIAKANAAFRKANKAAKQKHGKARTKALRKAREQRAKHISACKK